jgi:Mn-dependent DtxR family transcriptional regulator
MSRWFRVYDDAINDPKILKLPEATRWHWIAMLCIASKNDGVIPATDDVAISLRVKPAAAAAIIAGLKNAGLLDLVDGRFVPHNWDGRQFKSDVSNERVKRHRERKRNVTEAVTVTPPEAETEQKQSRTDARSDLQKRVGDFRQAIVKAFEAANSPTMIETSRAELWLTQGYQEDICLAVISEIVRKRPSITTLNYFDNAIKEAHASKAPPRQTFEIANPTAVDWEAICASYKKFGHWSKQGGNSPDSGSCRCPPEILAKHGIVVPTGEPDRPPALRAM